MAPQTAARRDAFKGGLEGFRHVFDQTTGAEAAAQFLETKKMLIQQLGKDGGDYAGDLVSSLSKGKCMVFPDPIKPVGATDKDGRVFYDSLDGDIWKQEMRDTKTRRVKLEAGLSKAYHTIMGQCSKAVLEKVRSEPTFSTVEATTDPIGLFKLLGTTMHCYRGSVAKGQAIVELIYSPPVQSSGMSHDTYHDKFRAWVEVLEAQGGDGLLHHSGLFTDAMVAVEASCGSGTSMADKTAAARAKGREVMLVHLYLQHSDQLRSGAICQELRNDYNKKMDNYPQTLVDAHSLLVNDSRSGNVVDGATRPTEHTFAQESSPPPGGPPRGRGPPPSGTSDRVMATAAQANPRPGVQCFRCDRYGHFRNHCRETTGADGSVLEPVEDVTMTLLAEVDNDDESYEFTFHTDSKKDDGRTAGAAGSGGNGLARKKRETAGKTNIPWWAILLDSQSTIDVFCTRSLLRNIRKAPNPCKIRCNAGVTTVTLIGDLPGYPEPVWFHPKGIANILSLSRVSEYWRVQYDSTESPACFHVTKSDGGVHDFKPSPNGLHFCDARKMAGEANVLVNTVADKKSKYTVRAYRQAELTRRLQDIIGRPSLTDFSAIIQGNELLNCPFQRSDVKAAEDIFGMNLGSLRGKTVYRQSAHVPSEVGDVPCDILDAHRDVTICFDIMYVMNIPFLVTLSRKLRFGTVERLQSRHATVLEKSLTQLINFYRRRGFRVKAGHADGEFACLTDALAGLGCRLNTCGENEHVPEIERFIRTLKERIRATYNTMPFARIPLKMVEHMVFLSNFWLNAFPARDGVSTTQSPRQIMTGQRIDYNKHCRLLFGEYVQTHESHDNSMQSRTTGAIALRPTGNVQGSYFFLSLTTGRVLNRSRWTSLPMPGEVIERVHALCTNEASQATGNGLVFGWRDASEIDDLPSDADDLHDQSYAPTDGADDSADSGSFTSESSSGVRDDASSSESESSTGVDNNSGSSASSTTSDVDDYYFTSDGRSESSESGSSTGVDHNDESSASSTTSEVDDYYFTSDGRGAGDDTDRESDSETEIDGNSETESDDYERHDDTAEVPVSTPTGRLTGVSTDTPTATGQPQGVGADTPTPEGVGTSASTRTVSWDDADRVMAAKYGARRRSGLRPRRQPRTSSKIKEPQSAAHHTLNAMLGDELRGLQGFSDLEHVALTQYNLKRGLKVFGKRAADAVLAELTQLHDRKTITPKMAHHLTLEEKRKALGYLMFIKEKRCGKIKARGCADGRPQRAYYTKADTSSPTVRTESLLLSCVIDAKEKREVMTCDVPGAFMQVDIDEKVHVKFEGPMADLLAKVDPKLYTKYKKQMANGRTILYVELEKALYGTLRASMLFWKSLSKFLRAQGYVANSYDACVMNKMVNGKQCTVLWHVDDLKCSHVDGAVLEELLGKLNGRYGKETPLTVTRGLVHDYLGMTIDYQTPGKVKIIMEDYVEDVIDELPDGFLERDITAVTPAAAHLFTVNENAIALDSNESDLFHSVTAKLLFLCKRARPDIQTPIAFLCTRVQRPDVDDMKKLRRVLHYLRDTKKLHLTLEAEDLCVVKWWVDASFAVHHDMRSHTGATMSMGKGSVYSASIRQKINTKSSTEAELVGVDDMMPQILWTRLFLEGQGYTITDNILYQDNKSSILLEKNGQRSSSKRTRHLNVRYYFVTDRVNAGDLTIEYCPTGDMNGDPFTKPLQGAAFRRFRKIILNLDEE